MKRLSVTALAVLFAAACGKTVDIQYFSAVSPSIAPGESTDLVIRANPDAKLMIDQGIGDVTGKTLVKISPTSTTTYTLIALTWYGHTTASTTVTVGHGPAAQVTLDGLGTELGVDTPANVTVTVRDRFGNPVTDYTGTLHFASTDTAAPAVPDVTFTVAMRGTTSITVVFVTQGPQSLIATDTANASLTASVVTQVRAGSATAYTLSALPASAAAGDPLALTITAVDKHGNVVKNYAGTAHASSTDATDRLPADGGFSNGVRTVALTFVTAGSHFATVAELGGTIATNTSTVAIANAPATSVVLTGLPTSVTVDTPTSVTVTLRDRFGNVATDYSGTVHFVLTDNAAPVLSDLTFTPAMQGTATISVVFATAGEQSLIATDTVNGALTTSTITQVRAGTATAYTLSTLPGSAIAGEPLPLTITAVDRHGNVVKNYAGTAHVSSTDPRDRLPGDGTFTNGVRTVSLAFLTAASHFVTVSEVAGTISANTTTVNVVSGDAKQLIASGQATTAGAATSTTVTAKDTYGNTVTSYTGAVTFSSTDAQAVLPAPYTFVTSDAGQHSFSLALKTAGAQTVTATDAALSISGSGGFSVAPAAGVSCAVTDLPASAAAGAQLGLRVTVSDAFSNVATGYSGTMALSSSDTAAQLSAPSTYTATDAGSHSFSVQLRTAGNQTVTATDFANSISCQGSVTLIPGATLFAVSFTGTDAWAGTAVNATITAQDSFGNGVTNYAGTIAFTSSDALAVTPANVTLNGTEGGTAIVSVTFNSIGTQTLTATDTAVSSTTGTGTQTVHGLVYTDPASGGKVRLIRNASSTASLIQLDLVSNATLFAITAGTNDTVRNGVFAAGMNLPLVDATKVGADTTFLVTTAPTGSTAILALGTGTQAKGAAIDNGVLYSGISQKRFDTTAGAASNNMRGDVSVRPYPNGASPPGSFYYSLRLRLTPGAAPGTVFDGQTLGSTFHAAVRDRSGTDVFQNADFAIGKLEVR